MREAPAGTAAVPVHPAEAAVEWAAALALIGAGMVSGFTHVVGNARVHGVTTWLAWAIAVTVELVTLYAAVKLRRRLVERRRVWPPALLGTAGFVLSMASQLSQAERSVWGFVYNGWPVVGALWVAKLTLSDLVHRAEAMTQQRVGQADHDAELTRVNALVHDLGQRLGQAEALTRAVTQEMDQRVTQLVDQHEAEVARLNGEVKRLTGLAEKTAMPESGKAPRKTAGSNAGDGEKQFDRATRAAVEFRAKHRRRPSRTELAETAGVSASTAKRALAELGDEAVLSVVEGVR